MLFQLPTIAIIGSVFVLGLLFGSFLNVVIYRVPKKMDLEQDEGIAEYLEQKVTKKESIDFLPLANECPQCHRRSRLSESVVLVPEESRDKPKPFNLCTPASTCPECGHKIRWWENIPVFSWLFLRGKCSSCNKPISFRYPFIELLTAILFAAVAWLFGPSIQTPLWCFFVFMSLAIAGIDWDTTWLPDSLSLSLLWAGLIAALLGWIDITIEQSIWGAVAGYLSLWTLATLFKLITGRIGMANGDFKMLAALGAWFGWQYLLPILLLSSIVGVIGYIIIKLLQTTAGLFEGKYMPFGPYLVGAGLFLLLITPTLFQKLFPFLILNL